jgi:AcrR family transcriptional regulator
MKVKIKQRLNQDERKQAMLAAARELFLEKGYANTSLDDIVARSGGSLTTLYQLFGNKDGLWRELVYTYTQKTVAPMIAPPDHALGPPRDVLRAVAMQLMALKMNPDSWAGIRMIMTEGQKAPNLPRLMYENGPQAGTQSLERYLAAQVAAGTLAIADTSLAAHLFCNLIMGEHQVWAACGIDLRMSPAEVERFVDEAVSLFLARYEIRAGQSASSIRS